MLLTDSTCSATSFFFSKRWKRVDQRRRTCLVETDVDIEFETPKDVLPRGRYPKKRLFKKGFFLNQRWKRVDQRRRTCLVETDVDIEFETPKDVLPRGRDPKKRLFKKGSGFNTNIFRTRSARLRLASFSPTHLLGPFLGSSPRLRLASFSPTHLLGPFLGPSPD